MPEEVDALGLDLAVEGHVADALLAAEEDAQAARVDDGAGKRVRAGLLALLEHRDRDVSQPLGQAGRFGDQLPEPDRSREPRRAGSHDEDPDLDPLSGRVGRLGDELVRVERRRIVGRPSRH